MDHEDRLGNQAHSEVELRLHKDGLCWGEMLWSTRGMLFDELTTLCDPLTFR